MARRRSRLTQRELAERLGCRQATIARWERGDRLPSFEEVRGAVEACGLALETHVVEEDRSWWPQIAAQLSLSPLDRLGRLTTNHAPDLRGALRSIAASGVPAIIVGEVAGALRGWPLVVRSEVIEVCPRPQRRAWAQSVERLGAELAGEGRYRLPSGVVLVVNEAPAGTFGWSDLARSATDLDVGGRPLAVASVVDLLRIADASSDPGARRDALALDAIVNVERVRRESRPQSETPIEEIDAWLNSQTPLT